MYADLRWMVFQQIDTDVDIQQVVHLKGLSFFRNPLIPFGEEIWASDSYAIEKGSPRIIFGNENCHVSDPIDIDFLFSLSKYQLLPPLDPDDSIGDPVFGKVLQPALLIDLQLVPRTLDFNQFVSGRCPPTGSGKQNEVGES